MYFSQTNTEHQEVLSSFRISSFWNCSLTNVKIKHELGKTRIFVQLSAFYDGYNHDEAKEFVFHGPKLLYPASSLTQHPGSKYPRTAVGSREACIPSSFRLEVANNYSIHTLNPTQWTAAHTISSSSMKAVNNGLLRSFCATNSTICCVSGYCDPFFWSDSRTLLSSDLAMPPSSWRYHAQSCTDQLEVTRRKLCRAIALSLWWRYRMELDRQNLWDDVALVMTLPICQWEDRNARLCRGAVKTICKHASRLFDCGSQRLWRGVMTPYTSPYRGGTFHCTMPLWDENARTGYLASMYVLSRDLF